MGTIPVARTDNGDNIEESILAISFSNKGSRYICSRGSGQVDEHLASISLSGDLILHNLASGARAAELKDPNEQVSWLKQHSAPTAGIGFSPSNDKIIASVGLDKKLYTYNSGSRRPSAFISHEAPFSSLAFRVDGWTLAVGNSNGRVVFYDIRGKLQPFTVLRAYSSSEVGPAELSSLTSSSGSVSSTLSLPSSEEAPHKSHLGPLTRLHVPRSTYNLKDDMEVFSPLVDVQPITSSLDKLWNDHEGAKKEHLLTDKKLSSLLFPSSRRFAFADDGASDHPIFD
ncbi:hypothetical protein REPUB_Repub03eG0217100 [Reevesia pubescens]